MSATIVVMLAIGIGATTTAFSVYYQVLKRAVPAPDPERLVNLRELGSKPGELWCSPGGYCTLESAFSYPMFRDLEAQQSVFTGIAAQFAFQANITRETESTSGRGMLVSGSYFGVLGVQPLTGRLITPEDERAIGESPVVVLSYDFWQNRFGGDPGVVGESLTVNGQLLTVVGVAAESFFGTTLGWRPEIYVPLTMHWRVVPTAYENQENRRSYWLNLFARLNPDTSLEQAGVAIATVHTALLSGSELAAQPLLSESERAEFFARRTVLDAGAQGQSALRQTAGEPLTFLLAVTGLLLLTVCVNVGSLLFARGASRASELAVRAAIGASRSRLLAQLVIEAGVLALLGGLASIPTAMIALDVIESVVPYQLAADLDVTPDFTILLFTLAATAVTVVASGLVPAWHTSSTNPDHVIKGHGAKVFGTARGARARFFLGVAQIAVSLVLLVLAGLFFLSLSNISRVRLGFNPDSLVTFSVSPQLNGYSTDQIELLYQRIRETVAAQPGVVGIASADVPLIENRSFNFVVAAAGQEVRQDLDHVALVNFIGPEYFSVLEIPLLAGREFVDADRFGPLPVAIINESLLRRFGFGSAQDAIGKQVNFQPLDDPLEIVGVVADAKYRDIKGAMEPQFFAPRALFAEWPLGVISEYFYVRSTAAPEAMLRTIPRVVAEIDPALPVGYLGSMDARIRENVYSDRLVTMLVASIAGLATLLAALGLYAVLAFNIAQRTHEFGLRIALGGQPQDLRRLVVLQGAAIAMIGGAIGIGGALVVGRVAESLLFGLSGYQPMVLAGSALVVVAVVAAATYLPARHASRIAPMEALRYE